MEVIVDEVTIQSDFLPRAFDLLSNWVLVYSGENANYLFDARRIFIFVLQYYGPIHLHSQSQGILSYLL